MELHFLSLLNVWYFKHNISETETLFHPKTKGWGGTY
jgi:hypothetical protein